MNPLSALCVLLLCALVTRGDFTNDVPFGEFDAFLEQNKNRHVFVALYNSGLTRPPHIQTCTR